MSTADIAHKYLLTKVLTEGFSNEGQNVRARWQDGTPAYTKIIFGETIRYDLSVEFPVVTVRPTNFTACVNEIRWIWQMKSNNVHDLKSKIWDQWADESGSIGKAYGYQLRQEHRFPEGMADQVDHILYTLKNLPADKRMITNMFNHADLSEMALAPCVYGCNFNVINGKLNILVNQRSADLIVAGGWNVTQYAILLHMFAQVSGLKAGELIYVIGDAHVYDRHTPFAEELIIREPFPAPQLIINPDIKNFYDFKDEDFELRNYQTHPQIKNIPVAA